MSLGEIPAQISLHILHCIFAPTKTRLSGEFIYSFFLQNQMAQNLSNSSDLVDTHLSLSNEDLIKAIWVSILIVVGVTGNLLTLLAIPYAKFKRRY